ncbi:hypothetical protein [Pseudomonas frederiksbergensis]|uniref:hypothetical protein n=1 Tax=Pseudomonas frederiksbergensis TaxID=104087 RepID=UPI0013D39D43|nr:hypothetical protein [Pseudomonas frederiksbergensis]
MRRVFLLLPLFLSLSGCEKIANAPGANQGNATSSATTPSAPAPAPTEKFVYKFEINTGSPEQALETWWRYLGAMAAVADANCKTIIKERTDEFDVSRVATGEVVQSFKSRGRLCKKTVYKREIIEVKQETEVRAIATVKVTNVTPSSVSHTEDDEEIRNTGETLRYLVEKTANDWKVSQVYKYRASNTLIDKDEWAAEYNPYVESYPIYILDDQ